MLRKDWTKKLKDDLTRIDCKDILIAIVLATSLSACCKHNHDIPQSTVSFNIKLEDTEINDGDNDDKFLVIVLKTEGSEKKFSVPALSFSLDLEAGHYTLCILRSNNCKLLNPPYVEVEEASSYSGNDDAMGGMVEFDVPGADSSFEVELKSIVAHYRIVATDFEEPHIDEIAEYSVKTDYSGFLPTMINLGTLEPCDAATGYSFLSKPSLTDDDIVICEDYIFAGSEESFVKASVTILDKGGDVVGGASSLKIPYKRGHTTIIKGEIFKQLPPASGITIDKEWNGEYIVEF